MDVMVYGAEKAPPGFRVVKSVEELRRHVGKAFLVVVGDRRHGGRSRRREPPLRCRLSREGSQAYREEGRVYPPPDALRHASQEERG